MRLLLALFCIFYWNNHALAQTFVAVPDPLLQKEIQFEQANECYIYFDNLSGDSLQLHWRLVESNLPDTWDADLCDYGTCYIGIPSNGLMNPVYDTIQPYLKLIVQPGTNPGATWIWFRVYEEGNTDNFEDVFYSLHTPGTLSADAPETSALIAFPNPVNALLELKNDQDLQTDVMIRNLNGQAFWQGIIPGQSSQLIPTTQWPSGLYVLQQENHSQKLVILH